MDKEVQIDVWCGECGANYTVYEECDAAYTCKCCGSDNVIRHRSIICDCGEEVTLLSITNECDKCGRLYNSCGQELAPYEEWDDEDRYDCCGPQNIGDE